MNPLVAGIVLLLALVVWIALATSRIAQMRSRARSRWQAIEQQLQQRWELIPNVVASVQEHAPQETEIYDRVQAALARSRAETNPRALALAEEGLKEVMKKLFELVAQDSVIRTDKQFNELAQRLEQVEDAIQKAKKHYNAATRNYNLEIQAFPKSFLANLFGFRDRQTYSITDETEQRSARTHF